MAALDWASSSSAAPTSVPRSFDVFLNFRGKDIRNNFISFLHKALKDRGINVFVDSDKQWVGETIASTLRKAIEGSKIYIPVFSKGYADSKWCLQELALIVQCHRSNGQLILPIFYKVDPSQVRHQEGSFKEAFCKHQKEFNPDIVKEWRDAMETVGKLIGEVLDKTKNQAELVELVVKRVSGELIIKTHLDICEYPTGIDSSKNYLKSFLNIDSNDVKFVGICGFGGIGKTTIAKAIYNDLLSTFHKHSFLSDVREQAKQYLGLVSLQKRLLKDIFNTDIDIADVHRGKILMREKLCKEKILVVLDDVDSKEQVDALVGKHTWFGEGSRIIITTRDENILNVAKVNNVYRPQVLNLEKSLQLFSWHAFQKDQPPEDYMQLSRDMAHYSGGLPLTLKVLGSYLLDISDKEEWESTLQKLKEIPNDEIQTRLKISYDNLKDDYQKTIFLDAACFFIGWEKEIVISIWEACGCYPKSTIPNLIKRSLFNFEVGWEGEYELRMHDQIRDMGREIVRTENSLEPSKRSRLWCYGDILDFLKEPTGTGRMRGMKLPYAVSYPNLGSEHFQMIPNLRFLDTGNGNFVGDFSHFPSALRCLTWCCNWEIIPSKSSHDELVYLDLESNKVKQAWADRPEDENKCFKKLKYLYLRDCHFLCKSPEFSRFPILERLNLDGCESLEMLDESIGQLSELKYLNLGYCESLQELPDGVGLLEKLEVLNVESCNGLKKLPRSMERMRCLYSIYLSRCNKLEELPELPSSLVELCCNNCYLLVRLPDLSRLKNLSKLKLNGCKKLEEIQGLEGTKSLEELEAKGCYNLTRIHRMILGQGTHFPDRLLSGDHYYSSIAISKIPDEFSSLKNLKRLDLSRCNKLEELPELPSSLVELCCDNCYSLVRLPDFSRLKFLRKLKLRRCEKLEEIQGLEGTESLEELEAVDCYNLTRIQRKILAQGTLLPDRLLSGDRYYSSIAISKIPDEFSSLKNLKRLDLSRCNKLEELPELPSSLVELCCGDCYSLVRLPDMSRLKNLSKLKLNGCKKLEEIQGLEGTESLEELKPIGCYNLTRIQRTILGQGTFLPDRLLSGDRYYSSIAISKIPDEFSSLKNLKRLDLSKCKKLEELPELPSSLVELCCGDCYSLVRLPDLSRLKILSKLKLNGCKKLEEIQGLEGTESLKELEALGCYNLTHTRRKIFYQGTVLPDRPPLHGYTFTAAADGIYTNSTGLILCIIFGYDSFCLMDGCKISLDLRISALVCQKGKKTRCLHSLKIEGVECTTVRDTIYIQYFKGFDWFGIPLQGEDSIKILGIVAESFQLHYKGFDWFDWFIDSFLKVKFWKLLHENKKPDQQMPNQYSDASPSGGLEEEELDFFDWLRVYRPFLIGNTEDANIDDALSLFLSLDLTLPSPCTVTSLDDGSNQQPQVDQLSHVQENGKTPPPSPFHHTEEEDPKRNNTTIDLLSCLGLDSVSDGVEKEGEMLRARLHDNNDEAPDPSLSLTLSTSSEMKSNNGFNLQQMLSQPPNIDDDYEAAGLSLSLASIPYQDLNDPNS